MIINFRNAVVSVGGLIRSGFGDLEQTLRTRQWQFGTMNFQMEGSFGVGLSDNQSVQVRKTKASSGRLMKIIPAHRDDLNKTGT